MVLSRINSRSNSASAAKNAEHQTTAGGCGVDIGTLAGEDAEADLALHQMMDGVDEMAQEAVEFPDNEGVVVPQGLQTGFKAGTVILLARSPVLIEPGCLYARRNQSFMRQVKNLRAVHLRYPYVGVRTRKCILCPTRSNEEAT